MKRITNLISHDQDEVLEFIKGEDQPSTYEDFGDFKLLVLRRLRLADQSMILWSEVFLFLPDKIYYFERDKDIFVPLDKGMTDFCEILRGFYEHNHKIIVGYSEEVESLENNLFERNIARHFMDLWFKIKKDLAKFENFYYRSLLVFREFKRSVPDEFQSGAELLEEIDETIGFQNSNILTLKSRLDSLHHYYNSIKQERLNKTIFMLTVISAIFLPMNLIVGFFGMNTEGLFFKDNPQGTINVVFILIAVTILALLGLKVIRVVDQYLLRFLLGRFNFYKNISKRFEDIESRLKGSFGN